MNPAIRPSAPRRENDAGSSTVLAGALVAVAVVAALAVAQGGALISAGARADAAADLAALAAARADRDARASGAAPRTALRQGCSVAADVASRNGAIMTSCVRAPGYSVTVTVAVSTSGWPDDIETTARAGPDIRRPGGDSG